MKFSSLVCTLLGASWFLPVTGFCADDGNKLLAQLQSKEHYENLQAYNYIRAIVDYEAVLVIKESTEIALSNANPKKTKFGMTLFCVPDGVTGKQVFDIVQQYLEVNPSVRHYGGLASVRRPLLAVWPCRGNEATSPSIGAK